MENELIKTKIENLIKETKQLRIDEVISYIKLNFLKMNSVGKILMKEVIFIMIVEILFI